MSILRVIQPAIAPNEWNVVQSQRQACSSRYPQGVAILLLDSENIKLCAEEESFLETCCTHSMQIKIAFANWRSVCKQQDVELNERGYQMLHVPAGKNSADMKMTAVGSSLFMAYPHVKEVLVCSSDGDLAHLCNTLQASGLTTYAVRRQSESLHITNMTTGQIFHYKQPPSVTLPTEECLNSLKALMRSQQQVTSNQWVQLSWLSKKFQETYGFTLSEWVRNYSAPGKKARDLFLDRPEEFVIHQVAEKSAIYISLFSSADEPSIPLKSASTTQSKPLPSDPSTSKVGSRQTLAKALVNALTTLTLETKLDSAKISALLSQFHQQQRLPIKHFLKILKIDQKPVAFLKTCPMFELELIQNNWHIKLVKR